MAYDLIFWFFVMAGIYYLFFDGTPKSYPNRSGAVLAPYTLTKTAMGLLKLGANCIKFIPYQYQPYIVLLDILIWRKLLKNV